tara:strand:- start:141 stop:329 length:189 start_codon:yes stop_codon:yes gene_type:complete
MPKHIDLVVIDLEELILVTGSFFFSGHTLEEVDTDVIRKLVELSEAELEYRLTGIPTDEVIH